MEGRPRELLLGREGGPARPGAGRQGGVDERPAPRRGRHPGTAPIVTRDLRGLVKVNPIANWSTSTCRATSPTTTSRSTRCSSRATPRSAASPAPAGPPTPATPLGPLGGQGQDGVRHPHVGSPRRAGASLGRPMTRSGGVMRTAGPACDPVRRPRPASRWTAAQPATNRGGPAAAMTPGRARRWRCRHLWPPAPARPG